MLWEKDVDSSPTSWAACDTCNISPWDISMDKKLILANEQSFVPTQFLNNIPVRLQKPHDFWCFCQVFTCLWNVSRILLLYPNPMKHLITEMFVGHKRNTGSMWSRKNALSIVGNSHIAVFTSYSPSGAYGMTELTCKVFKKLSCKWINIFHFMIDRQPY